MHAISPMQWEVMLLGKTSLIDGSNYSTLHFVEIIQTIWIPMDSIRSCDMLKQDTESFYKLIMENKHDRQSQQGRERSKSIHNTNIFTGQAYCSKPLYLLLYIHQGIMKKLQCTLLTRVSCNLLIVSHWSRQNWPTVSQFLASTQYSLLAQFMSNVIPII